ncbi:MAG: hypothetical protein JXB88_16235 [Spirochaetales bacterium]|nr:hypothetical protein [Spirochaetales bacterium]
MEELTVGSIVKGAFEKGTKNLVPILINYLLWLLTLWIPYINIGTTICILTLAAKVSKDEPISNTEIFNPVYRKRMGEFFLAGSFIGMGVGMGMLFFIAPGIVIALAWSLALLLVVDKELNPLEAINKSNTLTYGKKGTIFLGILVISVIIAVVTAIIMAIVNLVFKPTPLGYSFPMNLISMPHPVAFIIQLVIGAVLAPFSIGAWSIIYGTLVKKLEA